MAAFGQETITVKRQRFVLRTPINGAELQKMISAACRARAGLGSPGDLPDDALWVTVEDDDIVISWEELVHDAG